MQGVHHTYSQLWCSREQPQSLLCGRLLYLQTLDNTLFIDFDYWSVHMLGCCISTPIALCNRRVELSFDTYFFHQLVQRDFYRPVLLLMTGILNVLSIPVYLTNMLGRSSIDTCLFDQYVKINRHKKLLF